eukprot:m.356160 g.356160  ORF g.356160 m.356160 type:complete len:596 (+) comp20747_c0_seq1:291-2078(+)
MSYAPSYGSRDAERNGSVSEGIRGDASTVYYGFDGLYGHSTPTRGSRSRDENSFLKSVLTELLSAVFDRVPPNVLEQLLQINDVGTCTSAASTPSSDDAPLVFHGRNRAERQHEACELLLAAVAADDMPRARRILTAFINKHKATSSASAPTPERRGDGARAGSSHMHASLSSSCTSGSSKPQRRKVKYTRSARNNDVSTASETDFDATNSSSSLPSNRFSRRLSSTSQYDASGDGGWESFEQSSYMEFPSQSAQVAERAGVAHAAVRLPMREAPGRSRWDKAGVPLVLGNDNTDVDIAVSPSAGGGHVQSSATQRHYNGHNKQSIHHHGNRAGPDIHWTHLTEVDMHTSSTVPPPVHTSSTSPRSVPPSKNIQTPPKPVSFWVSLSSTPPGHGTGDEMPPRGTHRLSATNGPSKASRYSGDISQQRFHARERNDSRGSMNANHMPTAVPHRPAREPKHRVGPQPRKPDTAEVDTYSDAGYKAFAAPVNGGIRSRAARGKFAQYTTPPRTLIRAHDVPSQWEKSLRQNAMSEKQDVGRDNVVGSREHTATATRRLQQPRGDAPTVSLVRMQSPTERLANGNAADALEWTELASFS